MPRFWGNSGESQGVVSRYGFTGLEPHRESCKWPRKIGGLIQNYWVAIDGVFGDITVGVNQDGSNLGP